MDLYYSYSTSFQGILPFEINKTCLAFLAMASYVLPIQSHHATPELSICLLNLFPHHEIRTVVII